MENIRVVFISVPRDEAKVFGKRIVEGRLAACFNIIPRIDSFYWGDNKVNTDEESLIIAKTTQQKIEALIMFVKDNHPYEIPEVIDMGPKGAAERFIQMAISRGGRDNITAIVVNVR